MKNDQFNIYLLMLLQTVMTDQTHKDRVATPRDLTSKHFIRLPQATYEQDNCSFSGLRFSIFTEVKFKEFKDKLFFLRTFKDHRKI